MYEHTLCVDVGQTSYARVRQTNMRAAEQNTKKRRLNAKKGVCYMVISLFRLLISSIVLHSNVANNKISKLDGGRNEWNFS